MINIMYALVKQPNTKPTKSNIQLSVMEKELELTLKETSW
jgi:hypothetical protein